MPRRWEGKLKIYRIAFDKWKEKQQGKVASCVEGKYFLKRSQTKATAAPSKVQKKKRKKTSATGMHPVQIRLDRGDFFALGGTYKSSTSAGMQQQLINSQSSKCKLHSSLWLAAWWSVPSWPIPNLIPSLGRTNVGRWVVATIVTNMDRMFISRDVCRSGRATTSAMRWMCKDTMASTWEDHGAIADRLGRWDPPTVIDSQENRENWNTFCEQSIEIFVN